MAFLTRNFSTRRKFILLMLFTTLVAVLVALSSSLFTQMKNSRKALEKENHTLARVIATGSRAALAFNNAQAAKKVLRALEAKNDILLGVLFNQEGKPLAKYHRPNSPSPPEVNIQDREYFWSEDYFYSLHKVEFGDEPVGKLYLVSDLSKLKIQKLWYLRIIGGVSLIFAFLGAVLFFWKIG